MSDPKEKRRDPRSDAREDLPAGYPDDLSRSSTPESGSIGDKGNPIDNREPPFTGMKRSR